MKRDYCKKCGEEIVFGAGVVLTAGTNIPHTCKPKVKVFTDEEKRAYEKEILARKKPT